MKVVLAGNPNAGKTTLFNALARAGLPTGNWHGVTTRPARKTVDGITYADVPGMYSFNGYTMEEASAAEEIKSADVVINVADALTLTQSLSLTRALLAVNGRLILYVTKLGQLKRRGGRLDAQKLSRALGVPVATDVKRLKRLLRSPLRGEPRCADFSVSALNGAYYGGNCTLTRAERLFYNRAFAPAFFILAVFAMFFLAFFPHMPGAALKELCERLIVERLGGAVRAGLPEGKLRSFVCDGLIGGAGGVLAFVPQLAVLYLFLTLLDESGVMSALSFVTDGVFGKAGLSGRAAFSMISGFGCTAAAILTTRGFSSRAAQRRAVAVLAYIPCGAKLPVFLTLLSPLFADPFPAVCALYFAGITLALAVSAVTGGGGEVILSEVTPVALPSPRAVLKKLCFYLKGFIIKVATAVLVFCAVSWLLSNYTFALRPCAPEESMLAAVSRAALPLFVPMGVTDWRLSYALISGFAAKENIAATIAVLMPEDTGADMAAGLAVAAFVLACPACVSAFSAACKEVGTRYAAKVFLLQLAGAFLLAYAVRFVVALF